MLSPKKNQSSKIELVLFKGGECPETKAIKTYLQLCNKVDLVEIETYRSSFTNPFDLIFASKQLRDDVHGEYPFLLYKHHYIQKDKILEFCKRKFNINANLSQKS